jgi:antitoxin HigA-1
MTLIWRIIIRRIIMLNKRKRRPTHPGEILREDVIPALNITQGEFARNLGVSRRTVNEILQEKRPVTVDTAHRLARALGTSPDVWLGLQQDVDLWDTLQAKGSEYERIRPLRAA